MEHKCPVCGCTKYNALNAEININKRRKNTKIKKGMTRYQVQDIVDQLESQRDAIVDQQLEGTVGEVSDFINEILVRILVGTDKEYAQKNMALGFDCTLKFRMTIIIDEAPKGFDFYDTDLPDEVDDIMTFMKKLKRKGVKCHLQHTIHDEILNGYGTNYEWDDIFNINEDVKRTKNKFNEEQKYV